MTNVANIKLRRRGADTVTSRHEPGPGAATVATTSRCDARTTSRDTMTTCRAATAAHPTISGGTHPTTSGDNASTGSDQRANTESVNFVQTGHISHLTWFSPRNTLLPIRLFNAGISHPTKAR